MAVEHPVMELATVIDPNLAHTPITVQFVDGYHMPCSEAASPYLAVGNTAGK